jgi:hypothetical protein
MTVLMFSLAGVPPMMGFMAKWAVLQAVVSHRPDLAGRRRGAVLADRRLLLPARREDHLVRRALAAIKATLAT